MRHLLMVAHGSRRDEANAAVQALADQMRIQAGESWDSVDCAFLELATPSIPDVVDSAVARGASEIVVVLYFLAPGKHVSSHIPEILETKRQQYPDVDIKLTQHLGTAPGIAALLLGLADDR